jgi:wyosine [tRNA(Phe)-imidazoG37] synthetase (radical SAM superfamily)
LEPTPEVKSRFFALNTLILAAMISQSPPLSSVYGPVPSWRFRRSLGIDPIGPVSTCPFNCAYCQLGEIQRQTLERQVFIPTEQIRRDLQAFAPWDVDVVTLSGSGEPTLALNLAAILSAAREITGRPVAVLTNSTLLGNAGVRQALGQADIVAAKLDAVSDEQLRRINRPVAGLDWAGIWAGLEQFRREWQGKLAIQTMLLSPWPPEDQARYARLMQQLQPDEIQLNTPTRPRPLERQLETRGARGLSRPYPVQILKSVSREVLQEWAGNIEAETGIPVRCVPLDKLWVNQKSD